MLKLSWQQLYLIFLTLLIRSTISIQCFNETKTVNYIDAPSRLVPLNNISFHTGAWASQSATNFIGYILLKEKMGVPVDFYPTNNPDEYWNIDTNYPYSFYTWFVDGSVDVSLEMWGHINTRANITDLIYDNSLKESVLGVLGDQGFFIPDYLTDAYSSSQIYAYYNDTQFKAYLVNETLTFLDIYGTDNMNLDDYIFWSNTDANFSKYDLIYKNITRPILWHNFESWVAAVLMKNMIVYHNLPIDIVFEQSDNVLTSISKAHYDLGLAFITYAWSPSTMLGIMDLAKVYFPPNPSSTWDEECISVTYSCDFPVEALFKNWISDIVNDVPEIDEFFQRFTVNREEIQDLLAIKYYIDIDSNNSLYNSSDFEKYYNATCQWLKNNTELWSSWIVDIERTYKTPSNNSSIILQIILGVFGGIIFLVVIGFISFKTIIFCKDLQDNWNDNMTKNEENNKYKKKLFMEFTIEFFNGTIVIVDLCFDIIALISIIYISPKDYNFNFTLIYFILTALAFIVVSCETYVRIVNLSETVNEIKTGVNIHNAVGKRRASVTRYNSFTNKLKNINVTKQKELVEETEEMENSFYFQILTELNILTIQQTLFNRNIRSYATSIFVAFGECLPMVIINCYAIFNSNTLNIYIFLSLLFSMFTLGIKYTESYGFFELLEQRRFNDLNINRLIQIKTKIKKNNEKQEEKQYKQEVKIEKEEQDDKEEIVLAAVNLQPTANEGLIIDSTFEDTQVIS